MFFKDIIGQDRLKQQIISSIQSGVVPHSQLFCGRTGYGSFCMAFAYARYLNCTHRTESDACGHCPSCLKYNDIVHPDLYFIFPMAQEGKKNVCDDYMSEWRGFLSTHLYFDLNMWLNEMDATKQAIIYSKESEEIMRKVSFKIYEAAYRVFLIWIPERMHSNCANKLLKVIEEPPLNTIILMVSDEPDRILGTILSRSQRINVKPIQPEDLARYAQSKYELDEAGALQIARMAHGDYLQMIEIMHDSEENAFFLKQFVLMMRNSWAKNVKGMKIFADEMASLRKDRQRNLLSYCQRFVRENFIHRFQSSEMCFMNREETEFAEKFSPYVNERNVFEFMEELAIAERHLAQNVNPKMVFFDLALRITVLLQK
ncbi:MAG: DNA polymerase III subunit delta [Tannerella sp.]|jgi:DNA polymerase-3 subunit delta'|nr:DNA polymerase III subunit delta [Tannerella sp.]